MPLEQPCVLWSIPWSAIAQGLAVGTIALEIDTVPYTVNFPAAGALSGFYYLSGDGSPTDLIDVLEDALNAQASGETFDVTHDGAGHLTITCSNVFRILGSSVLTTVDLTIFGLGNDAAYPAIAALVLHPPRAHKGAWYPVLTQSDDDLDAKPIVGAISQSIDGTPFAVRIATTRYERLGLRWDALDASIVRIQRAADTEVYLTFEYGWENSIANGFPFRFYQDGTVRTPTSFSTYELAEFGTDFPWKRTAEHGLFFDVFFPELSLVP